MKKNKSHIYAKKFIFKIDNLLYKICSFCIWSTMLLRIYSVFLSKLNWTKNSSSNDYSSVYLYLNAVFYLHFLLAFSARFRDSRSLSLFMRSRAVILHLRLVTRTLPRLRIFLNYARSHSSLICKIETMGTSHEIFLEVWDLAEMCK